MDIGTAISLPEHLVLKDLEFMSDIASGYGNTFTVSRPAGADKLQYSSRKQDHKDKKILKVLCVHNFNLPNDPCLGII
jgi:hypothetical protein